MVGLLDYWSDGLLKFHPLLQRDSAKSFYLQLKLKSAKFIVRTEQVTGIFRPWMLLSYSCKEPKGTNMQRTIALDIADKELSQAHQAVLQAGFGMEEYLNIVVKAIASSQPMPEDMVERLFHLLPDVTVMNLAHLKMPEKDSKRFSRLLEKQGEGKLNEKERNQLAELAEVYERGTLRKAYAMAEAVRRGLMPPLQS